MATLVPEPIRMWLRGEKAWKPGLDPKICTTIAFTPLPEKRTQLVTLGLPNTPEEAQTAAVFTDCQLRLENGGWDLQIGRVYVARGHAVEQGTLLLPPRTSGSLVVPVVNDVQDAEAWVELFSGVGSWTWAAQRMGLQIAVAVDVNDDVSDLFRRNHPDVPHFNGDVSDLNWVPSIPVQGIAASPPCPAFSSLQQSPGFKAASAAPWTQLLSVVRTLQVPMVLIECVAGIQKRIPEVQEAFRLAGYRLIATQLADLSDLSATKRARWFGLFVRMHVCARSPLANAEFKRHAHNLTSFEALIPEDWPMDHLQIPPEGLDALRNPAFVRYAKNASQAWMKHTVHEYQQAPTFTHQYGNSWNLPHHTLMQGGLHCPVFSPRDAKHPARMFSPWEIARLHILPNTLVLPEDLLMSWQVLGNGVSPAQCTIGFGLALSMLGKATFKTVCETIDSFIRDAVAFQGRRPVFHQGWQRLETQYQSPPKVLETLPEAPSSPDWASDDSARCYCSTDVMPEPPRVNSPPLGDLQADYEILSPASSASSRSCQICSTQELTMAEREEHSRLFMKLHDLEQNEIMRTAPQMSQEAARSRSDEDDSKASEHDISPTIKWYPKGVQEASLIGQEVVSQSTQGTALAPAMAPKSKKRPQSLQHPLDTPASSRTSANTDMLSPADVATPGTTSSPLTPEEAFRGRDRERSPLLRRRPEGTTPPTPPTPRSGSTQRQQRQALEQSQQALEGVRSIQVREEDCSDTIVVKLHGSNPLAILKLLSVTDDARVIRKIEFCHVNLASHTLAHALPTAPWVLLSTENYNAHGEQRGFRLQRDFVKDLARMPFVTENGTCPFDMASEPTEPLVTTRQPFDSWTLLPDGRSVFLGFKGDPLDTSLLKDQLYSKFHRQFAGGNICLWAPCKCRTHWRQLLDDEVHAPGGDLSAIALPGSLGLVRGLIPAVIAPDVTVDLREVPRRAMRHGKGKGSQSSSQGSIMRAS